MFERSKKAMSGAMWLIAVAAVPALSVLALSLTPHPHDNDASALYVVSNDAYVHVDELAGDVFLTDGSDGLVSRREGSELQLTAGRNAAVSHQGATRYTVTEDETVSELLERLAIYPSPLEMVSLAYLDNLLEIRIDSEFVFYEHISTVTEHEIVYQYNDQKPDWQETVLQEGADGEYREVYEVIYQDGEETGRHLIDVVDTEAVPTIIERGTMANFANNGDAVAAISTQADGSGTITLDNGQTLTFSSSRTMKGTAYTTGGKVVIAYEPVWAIGPGKTPPGREFIQEVAQVIKGITGGLDVVYGGGLKADNAQMLASIPEIAGGLIALTRFTGEIGFYPDEYIEIIRLYLGK